MTDLQSLQYPVGKPSRPASLSPEERAAAISTLAAFPQHLATALEGLSEAQVDTPYRPGGWTIRQLVHHVADSHMNAYSRMRVAITSGDYTEWPAIYAYDQNAWAALPEAHTLPPRISLQLLDALHQRWVATLKDLPESKWSQGYRHPENGPQRLDQALALYDWHSRHHLAHIVNWRKSLDVK